MKRVLLQPAYLLHRRAYRETSFLIDLFTSEYGRLTLIAKGVRKAKAATQGLLQPFTPLNVSWAGKGELMTLSYVEARGAVKQLTGDCLFAGLYLNELLMNLLQRWDAHSGLYAIYEHALSVLQSGTLREAVLRTFEKHLLEEIGYGLLQKYDVSLHNTILPDRYYRFVFEQGFVLSDLDTVSQASSSNLFLGKNLLAIAKEDWRDEASLSDAKRLMRLILAPLLGSRPLYSRKLFMQPDEESKHEG